MRIIQENKDCLICGKKNIVQPYTCNKCWSKLDGDDMRRIWKIHATIPDYIPREQVSKYIKIKYDNR